MMIALPFLPVTWNCWKNRNGIFKRPSKKPRILRPSAIASFHRRKKQRGKHA